ncbi:MAG: hypothetical protein RIR26_2648 [Pseudomonadota bacterium]
MFCMEVNSCLAPEFSSSDEGSRISQGTVDRRGVALAFERLQRRGKGISVCAGLLVSLTSGCATLTVTSKPSGAEVVLAIPGQEAGKVIGKTPLNQDLAELKKYTNKNTIVLSIKRSGFITQSFVVPNLGGGQLEIDASLQPLGADDASSINLAVRLILEAERQIIDRNFKEALKTLEKAKATNPFIAAAHMFEGMIYLLQNEKEKAREALFRALALDPQDTEVRSMLTDAGGTPTDTGGGRGKRK